MILGNGGVYDGGTASATVGGGGGGAIGVGEAGNSDNPGGGGAGAFYIDTSYGAGGGGGGSYSGANGGSTENYGESEYSYHTAGSGAANTGNGGGGGYKYTQTGGSGGSGIVIISYPALVTSTATVLVPIWSSSVWISGFQPSYPNYPVIDRSVGSYGSSWTVGTTFATPSGPYSGSTSTIHYGCIPYTLRGIVTTFAGGLEASGGDGPEGYDGVGTNAIISEPHGFDAIPGGAVIIDSDFCAVRKITYPGGVVTTLAGYSSDGPGYADGVGTNARFYLPYGCAVLSDGNIAVSDLGNNCIRIVTPAGVVTTLAGTPTLGYADGVGTNARFRSPMGIAALPDNTLVVCDSANKRIRLITYPGGVVTTLAGNGTNATVDGTGAGASFMGMNGCAIIPSTNAIAVIESGGCVVRIVTYPGGVVTTLAGNGYSGSFNDGVGTNAYFGGPQAIVALPNDTLVVADSNAGRICLVTYPEGAVTTLAGNGSAFTTDGVGTNAEFYIPYSVCAFPGGGILIGQQQHIRLIT
jgi:hypothetical protein